jgi:hypothetical protein
MSEKLKLVLELDQRMVDAIAIQMNYAEEVQEEGKKKKPNPESKLDFVGRMTQIQLARLCAAGEKKSRLIAGNKEATAIALKAKEEADKIERDTLEEFGIAPPKAPQAQQRPLPPQTV